MGAGNLNCKISLLEPVATRDSVGQELISFNLDKAVWAAINHLKGTTFFAASQTLGEVVLRVQIRKYQNIQATWRIEYESKQWQIVDLDQTDKQYTYLMVSTNLAVGLPVND